MRGIVSKPGNFGAAVPIPTAAGGGGGGTVTPRPTATNSATPIFDPTTGLYQVGNQVMIKKPDGTFEPVNQVTQPGRIVNQDALGRAFREGAQPYREDFDRAFGQQMSLADSLNTVINDVNAPSVAAEQEAQALQANENTQLAQASGASGANAAIARTNAANNIAGLNANAAADAGLRRAQEVATARGQLGATLATAAGESMGMYGGETGRGLAYDQLAAQTSAGDFANKTAQRGQNIGLGKDIATGIGSGLAAIGTGGASEAFKFAAPTDPDGIYTLQSDPAIKHDVADEDEDSERQFLRALSPKSFRYNGDAKGKPKRHGVMADAVEEGGPIGAALVKRGKGGTRGIDVEQGLGAALSALGYMFRRVEELEGDRG